MFRALVGFAVFCGAAWGCSCGDYPSAKEAWAGARLVLVGTVEKSDPAVVEGRIGSGEQVAWVRVQEAFKGVKKDQVLELRGELSSCFGGYTEGATLLLYLFPGAKHGTWVAPACHRSRTLDRAADDLQFLHGLPDSARGNRVSGTVALYEDDPVKGFHRSRDVAGVRVRLAGAAGSYDAVTDARGLYEFRNLQPGNYSIQADFPRGTTLRFPIPYGKTNLKRYSSLAAGDDLRLEVTAESGNGFDFLLAPDTRIRGRVLGPDRLP
jgi:hypothetical protein